MLEKQQVEQTADGIQPEVSGVQAGTEQQGRVEHGETRVQEVEAVDTAALEAEQVEEPLVAPTQDWPESRSQN